MGKIKIKAARFLITLLLVINVSVLFFFLNEKNQHNGSNVEIFTLDGKGAYWNVNNYTVIMTSNSIWRGSAGLSYVSNQAEIIASNYLRYEFLEVNKSSKPEIVLVGSKSAEGGDINILDNIESLGSISGQLTSQEKALIKDRLEEAYVNVIWTDSKGIEKSERIQLMIKKHVELK